MLSLTLARSLVRGQTRGQTRGQARGLSSGPDQVLEATEHRAWTAEGSVRLRLAEAGAQSRPPISVPTLLRQTVERWPGQTALRARTEEGEAVSWSYSDYHREVRQVARAWISLGLQPHHTLSVLGSLPHSHWSGTVEALL